MEFFISVFIIMIISSIVSEYFKKKTETKKNNQARANIIVSKAEIVASSEVVNESKNNKLVIKEKVEKVTINKTSDNYQKEKKTNRQKSKNEKHTEKVWKKLGYCIKKGETYSSYFRGNKLFTLEQVEKTVPCKVKYSEIGLTRKLLKNTGSESLTKKILIDKYGLSESKVDILIAEAKNKVIIYKSKNYNYENYSDSSMSEWIQQANMSKGWD